MPRAWISVFIACIVAIGVAGRSDAAFAFSEGDWRLEIQGAARIDAGDVDGPFGALALEYEVPMAGRATLGLRLLPLFVYGQNDGRATESFRDFFRGSNDDTVAGGGVGLATRFYARRRAHRGLFLELGAHVLAHGGEFEGNGSNVNFMTGAGLGYQFRFGLHTSVKWQHISNAGLDDDNDGLNMLGVGVGFRF